MKNIVLVNGFYGEISPHVLLRTNNSDYSPWHNFCLSLAGGWCSNMQSGVVSHWHLNIIIGVDGWGPKIKWEPQATEEVAGSRADGKDCSDCKWAMWLVFSKSKVHCKNQMKPGVGWSGVCVGGNPIIPPVLSNKSFVIFMVFFFQPCAGGVLELWDLKKKNAEFLILSQLKVLYKCQSWCVKIWDDAQLLRLWELS